MASAFRRGTRAAHGPTGAEGAESGTEPGSGPVVVLGLGRFGQALGEELMAGGVEVLCVDADPRVVQECSTKFDHVVSADTTNPEALRQLGVHHVIRPEADMGRQVAHLMGGKVQDYAEFERGFAVAKIAPPVSSLDHRVGEINARGDSPVQILAIRPRGEAFRRAIADDVIRAGDLVIAAGPVEELETFAARR